MTPAPQRLGYGTLDGVVALAIVTFGLAPGSHWHHNLHEVVSLRISFVDAIFGLCFMLAWRYCFTVLNLYDKFATVPSRTRAILTGVLIMLLPVLAYYKVEHPHDLRLRAVVLTSFALFIYEVNRSAFNVHLLDRLAARDPRRALIIGSGRRASKAWRVVRTRYRLSLKLLGFVDNRSVDDMPPDIARRYLGPLDSLDRIIVDQVVDLIFIAMPINSCYPLMQQAIHVAENAGVQVLYLDDIYSSRTQKRDASGSIFRELAVDQEHYLAFLVTKRLVDVIGSFLGLVILSPLFIAISIAIKLTGQGPILVRQERYGYRRRRFSMLRFQSMGQDAGGANRPLAGSSHPDQTSDMEATNPLAVRLARWLRHSSLDELPQLWNVLVGEMSLVGPRPMSVVDASHIESAALTRRFSVRPGITGLWQVSGMDTTDFGGSLAVDNHYIDERSLATDVSILARTIGSVFKGAGAV